MNDCYIQFGHELLDVGLCRGRNFRGMQTCPRFSLGRGRYRGYENSTSNFRSSTYRSSLYSTSRQRRVLHGKRVQIRRAPYLSTTPCNEPCGGKNKTQPASSSTAARSRINW